MITVYVKRFNRETDEEPHIESYEIEEFPGMKVLDALEETFKSMFPSKAGKITIKIVGVKSKNIAPRDIEVVREYEATR